ncbi:DUF1707 SHOCT-like domain-containing protein [Pseudonocardia alni]|uniref:DUF1707 SHOCT-like domain-containing protein n=1 Tax=Pseudonocardia alni TaxID=33907 RepID=UPI00280ACE24|nr:DUF1707 domain-containing protein [Pseudonocardia alni]
MTATPDTRPAPGPATAPAPAAPSPVTPPPADAVPAAPAPTTTAGGLPPRSDAVLASDAEREHVTARLRTAAAEGRLTLAESDERQAAAYAARTRDELVPLLAGLPRPPRPRRPRRGPLTPRAQRNLRIHAGVTVAVLLLLVLGAVLGPAPLFAPIGPAFWLGLILFVHSRRAEREASPDEELPEELR